MTTRVVYGLFAALLLSGCGPIGGGVQSVSGRAMLDDNPLANTTIVFWLKGEWAEPKGGVRTNEDGTFDLDVSAQAWKAGTYVAQVQTEPGKGSLPRIYLSPRTTPLEVLVYAGHNQLPDMHLATPSEDLE